MSKNGDGGHRILFGIARPIHLILICNYGVRSGAFCKLSGSDWFMLGWAITGGRWLAG